MGGGQSSPSSSEHNGVNIVTNTGAHSCNSYSNISSGGGNTSQSASSTGAGVTAGVTANVAPALLQELMPAMTMYTTAYGGCVQS